VSFWAAEKGFFVVDEFFLALGGDLGVTSDMIFVGEEIFAGRGGFGTEGFLATDAGLAGEIGLNNSWGGLLFGAVGVINCVSCSGVLGLIGADILVFCFFGFPLVSPTYVGCLFLAFLRLVFAGKAAFWI
jgi:hypothetical protein